MGGARWEQFFINLGGPGWSSHFSDPNIFLLLEVFSFYGVHHFVFF